VTNSSGGYAFAVVQAGSFGYRARYYGSATYTGAVKRAPFALPRTTTRLADDSTILEARIGVRRCGRAERKGRSC
jgi:hypothetical protein